LTLRWKNREPIKDAAKDEEDIWQQEWMNRLYLGGEPRLLMPLEQILLFTSFHDDIFGQERWSPRAKRWCTKELEEERDILGEARRTTLLSRIHFMQVRNRWLRAIRKANRECSESLLEASDLGEVWKAIKGMQQLCAIPSTPTSMSGEQYRTLAETMEAIAIISFPSNPADIPTIAQDTHEPEETGVNTDSIDGTAFKVCPKMLKHLQKLTCNTSASELDGIGWWELKIWFKLDPKGYYQISNELIKTGLPPELKVAIVIVIVKPGRRDRTKVKSY
jgi:hypothetical protein